MRQHLLLIFTLLFLAYCPALLAAPPEAPLATADGATDIKPPLPENRYVISFLIFGQGDDLFSRFGHIAIVVEDQKKGHTRVYNYGTFSFNDKKLMFKYARGYLRYWLGIVSYENTIRTYKYWDRQIDKYILNLTPAEAQNIADMLRVNALPKNRYYFYRHYYDNCCTRLRDIIDRLTGGAFKAEKSAQFTPGHTFRYWTRDCLVNMPVMGFLIDYVLGREIDHPISRWEEYFLPARFEEDLPSITMPDGRKLIKEHLILNNRQGPEPREQTPTWELIVVISLILIIFFTIILPPVLGPKKGLKRLFSLGLAFWGLLCGLGGLILIIFLFTAHTDTHWNENIVVTPITHFLLIWSAVSLWRKKANSEKRFAILSNYLFIHSAVLLIIMLLKIGPFIQQNWGLIFTMLLSNMWLALVAIPRLKLTDKNIIGRLLCKKNGSKE